MKNLSDIVKADLCLGCGLCNLNIDPAEEKVELIYSTSKGHFVPKMIKTKSKNSIIGFDLCPGRGYDIVSLGRKYNLGRKYGLEIGFYDQIKVVTTNNKEIQKKASSSGIMTIIINYLIEKKIVDHVIVTKFEYLESGPVAKAFIAKTFKEIIEAQGSKYCPVDFISVIEQLKENKGKNTFAFVGTPCQIASLRYIQSNIKNLGIKYFIGNFCGGFKSYNNLKQLIKLQKMKPDQVRFFRFRGGGQPGSLLIKNHERKSSVPYPEYVKMTGYLKLKRCHLCVDANAELADFACGDAWLPKYQASNIPTSIVITRTKEASLILNNLSNSGQINIDDISENDVIKSQYENIKSKKYRQKSRLKLYKMLGIKTPEIIEGYRKDVKTSLLLELNIFVRHRIKLFFEKIGLYYLLYYKKTFIQRFILNLWRKDK